MPPSSLAQHYSCSTTCWDQTAAAEKYTYVSYWAAE